MPNLSDKFATFQTGDLIFTRYPSKQKQPIHVTMFVAAKDAGGQASYIHAGNAGVELENAASYAEEAKLGKFIHASCLDASIRSVVSQVAARFADKNKVPVTPYGSYPDSKDFQALKLAPKSPHASRFTGMIATASFGEIPYEFPALRRTLKWTKKFIFSEAFSKNRGTTCAAFISACYQVAYMKRFLDTTGVRDHPELIEACLQRTKTWVKSKESLRSGLEVLATPVNKKPILRDQALRVNSNQNLLAEAKAALDKTASKIDLDEFVTITEKRKKEVAASAANSAASGSASSSGTQAALQDIEKYWLIMQTRLLNIPAAQAELLGDIFDTEFLFDAKYVNSRLLVERVMNSRNWINIEYDAY